MFFKHLFQKMTVLWALVFLTHAAGKYVFILQLYSVFNFIRCLIEEGGGGGTAYKCPFFYQNVIENFMKK